MLLPGCQCCGTTGCTCACGDYPSLYPNPTIPSINQCCDPQCLPCEVTIEFLPGNTWGGFYTIYLTPTDKAEIRAFLAQSFVTKPRCSAKTFTGSGALMDSLQVQWWYESANYSAAFGLEWTGSDSGLDCFNLWNQPYGEIYLNAIRGGISGPVLTLSSGIVLNSFYFRWNYYSGPYAPFSIGSWCGLSSWSYTHSITGYMGVTYQLVLSNPAVPNSGAASLEGNQVRFSW